MRLHLTSAYKVHPGLDTMLSNAKMDSKSQHSLCDDPERADAIVFIENTQFDDVLFHGLLKHPLLQRYPNKTFMYNEMDRPWDVLPGLYACMPRKHFDASRQRASAYLSTPNRYIRTVYQKNFERQWLYSFVGSMSHKCRRHIMHLPTTNALLQDTSDFNVWNTTPEQMEERAKTYAYTLGCSHFVLCPRGLGTSSLRLYETLEAGRVPVIISDQWVAPAETDWRFAIQIRERHICSLPGLLRSLENEAHERGDAARAAWLASYAPDALFTTFGNAIQFLLEHNKRESHKQSLNVQKWAAIAGLFSRTMLQHLRGNR